MVHPYYYTNFHFQPFYYQTGVWFNAAGGNAAEWIATFPDNIPSPAQEM
jgi:hypothetical protein